MTVTQLDLPGQAHVAEGPIDHSGMYLMHHAFRRDLDDLVAAVAHTPVGDGRTWQAIHAYWLLFEDLLHHHHVAEDQHYWPALVTAVEARGTAEDLDVITAMEDEHALLDPALDAVRAGMERVVAQPSEQDAAALHESLVTLRRLANDHMRHEETSALPLVSRTMDLTTYAAVEKAIGRGYPLRLVARLLPWVMHEVPPSAEAHVVEDAGTAYRVLLALTRRRFERFHAAAFGAGRPFRRE